MDYEKNLKLHLQPVAKYYLVGAVLSICHTCMYGNEGSSYFGLETLTIEEYLHFIKNNFMLCIVFKDCIHLLLLHQAIQTSASESCGARSKSLFHTLCYHNEMDKICVGKD